MLFPGIIFYDIGSVYGITVIGFFFSNLLILNIWLLEIIPGVFAEKAIYNREIHSGTLANSFSTWLTMGLPTLILSTFVALFYSIPVYYLSGLRSGFQYFFCFYVSNFLAIVSNLVLVYLVAFITPNIWINVIIYPGLLVPTSWAFSGYLSLYGTIPPWISWVCKLNYAWWYMNALFANQIDDDGTFKYSRIIETNNYDASVQTSWLYMIAFIATIKMVTLFAMKLVKFSKNLDNDIL